MSVFLISLDFELLFGVADSQRLDSYKNNILGERIAIPKILTLFEQYQIRGTWATVGMVMCKGYSQWNDLRPRLLPEYKDPKLSSYIYAPMVKEYPEYFFGRALVEQILQTSGQEVGGHSYSHFYCMEPGATSEQFAADLVCAREIANDLGIVYRSFVFPRNQVRADCLDVLARFDYGVYRGNPQHWLYARGDDVIGGALGRAVRLTDTYLPVSGPNVSRHTHHHEIVDCPASFFLRPWSRRLAVLEPLRMRRLKDAMLKAAQTGGDFHLWWHPHNFGINVEQNLEVLKGLLEYYVFLRDKYGMESKCMGDFLSKGSA